MKHGIVNWDFRIFDKVCLVFCLDELKRLQKPAKCGVLIYSV